ncbi:MAG: hypothetical protein ABII64_05925 [Elusimicrobiota bacterium]
MNYYIAAAAAATAVSLILFYSIWGKYPWRGRKAAMICFIAALSFSYLINVFVKAPIYKYVLSTLNINPSVSLWPVWFLPIGIAIGPFWEELIKAVPPVANRVFLKEKADIYYTGLMAGLGFGIGEAWYLAVQFAPLFPHYAPYGTGAALIYGFAGERMFSVFFHIVATGITAYGLCTGRPLQFFLIAVLSHFFTNFPLGMSQIGLMNIPIVSTVTIVSTIAFYGLLFYMFFARIDLNMKKQFRKSETIERKVIFERNESI